MSAILTTLGLAGPAWATRADGATCDALRTGSPPGTAESEEKHVIAVLLCSAPSYMNNVETKLAYLLDRPDRKPSELVRAAHVLNCLPRFGSDSRPYGDPNAYMICGADARRLDRKALDAELDARKFGPQARTAAIEAWNNAKQRADQYQKWAADEVKRIPTAQQTLIDLPEKYFKEWDELYQKNKEAIDEAYRIENQVDATPAAQRTGRDVKLTLGCEKLRKSWQGYVAAQKPASADDVVRFGTDAVGYTLLERLMLCDQMEGRLADAIAEELLLKQGGLSYRGPRYYVAAQLPRDLYEIGVVQKKEISGSATHPLRLPPGPLFAFATHPEGEVRNHTIMFEDKRQAANAQGHHSASVIESAKVASVKKRPDGMVEINYAKESWIEPDWLCTQSNRFNQWGAGGEPIFYKDCKVVGHHKVTFTLPTRQASAVYAGEVKKGQIVRTMTTNFDLRPPPFPTACVFEIDQPGKGAATPVSFLGIPLGGGEKVAAAKPAKKHK